MRIAILGAGSLGSLYGALLSQVDGVELLFMDEVFMGLIWLLKVFQSKENEIFVSNDDVFFFDSRFASGCFRNP